MSAQCPRPLDRLDVGRMRLGLLPMRTLLTALGSPERRVPQVLVAGTNGKGSTCVLLAAMAEAARYSVGLYTSPHLEEPEERIRINGVALGPHELDELIARILAAGEAAGVEPTYFEAMTAAAFLAFEHHHVDLAVLEVGLGGRLDATNTGDPMLSLLTAIDLDHEAQLGSTRAAIAREKAGILRPERPALAAAGSAEVRDAVAEVAREIGAQLTWVGGASEGPAPGLCGRHQRSNTTLAIAAAERLAELGFERIDRHTIAAGLSACTWPGRLEEVTLPGGRSVLLDGAHNPAGAASLAAELAERGWSGVTLLFGAFTDKRADEMLRTLAPHFARAVFTQAPGPRGRAPEELAAFVPAAMEIHVEPRSERALERALALDLRVVAAGSLALVGELRRELRRCFGVPPPASCPLFPTLRRVP